MTCESIAMPTDAFDASTDDLHEMLFLFEDFISYSLHE
jgi:hypothetical protein